MWFFAGLLVFTAITAVLFQIRSRPTWAGLPWSAGGNRAEYSVNRGKNGVKVRFGVATKADLQFTLRAERWYDRLAKLLTLSAEYQVGDDSFDRAVYVLSDSETVCRSLLGDVRLRADLLELIRAPRRKFRITHVQASAGKIWVRMTSSAQTVLDEEVLHEGEALAPALRAIAGKIGVLLKARPIDRDRSFVKAAVFAAISMGLAVNGAVALVVFAFANRGGPVMLDRAELLQHAVVLTAAVISVLVVSARVSLGSTSRGHLVLTELLTFGLLGGLATAWVALREVNVAFDRGAPVEVSADVLGKHARQGKGGMTYTIDVRDWTGRGGVRSFMVAGSVHEGVAAGRPIRLDQHPGRFGYRWIDNIRL